MTELLWTDANVEPYRAGSCEPWTVEILVALIRALVPPIILETGTFEGLTTEALAKAAPWAQIFSVEQDAERYEIAKRKLSIYPKVEVVHGDALKFIGIIPDNSLGFAFLDDDHAAGHVHEEMVALKPKMAPKGLITCHDVFGDFALHAVVSTHHGYSLDLLQLHAAGGLGLWQKR